MTIRELAERVYRARVDMERKTGRAEPPTAIILNYEDWLGLKIEHAGSISGKIGPLGNTLMGIPVEPDPRRQPGTVCLAWLVEV